MAGGGPPQRIVWRHRARLLDGHCDDLRAVLAQAALGVRVDQAGWQRGDASRAAPDRDRDMRAVVAGDKGDFRVRRVGRVADEFGHREGQSYGGQRGEPGGDRRLADVGVEGVRFVAGGLGHGGQDAGGHGAA